jgi:hypothetical protein
MNCGEVRRHCINCRGLSYGSMCIYTLAQVSCESFPGIKFLFSYPSSGFHDDATPQ